MHADDHGDTTQNRGCRAHLAQTATERRRQSARRRRRRKSSRIMGSEGDIIKKCTPLQDEGIAQGYSMGRFTFRAVRALHSGSRASVVGTNIPQQTPARLVPAVDAAGAGRCPRALESSQSMSLSFAQSSQTVLIDSQNRLGGLKPCLSVGNRPTAIKGPLSSRLTETSS